MKLAVTIDVEEEGLFSNRYDPHDPPVNNVAYLSTLDPIFREWGIRPTLLVTYPVITNGPCAELLAGLRTRWDGEIGAHLHHWNTPPIRELPYPQPAPSELMPPDLLSQKLNNLLNAVRAAADEPRSFRMGRFNLGPRMLAALESTAITVDSSVAPMRRYYGGPDHLAAPTDPYFPDKKDPMKEGDSGVLEVPMTILPVFRGLGYFLENVGTSAIPGSWISWFAMNLGSVPVQPMWTGLRRLKLGVRLHCGRGGQVLTLFLHSSELMPGGCPQHQTAADVDRFRTKLSRFFSWLRREIPVESVTLTELGEHYRSGKQARPCRSD
ncbi:MAG TPA: hypothetical protein VK463_21050 [Desulfomonilaceae bacterium]|nr:hypothetical protein [Desulfomonilaceae bacterium]